MRKPKKNSPRRAAEEPKKAPFPEAPVARPRIWPLGLLFAIVLFAAYANHFHNSFHFDDSHTIENNVYIRDLHNLPRFFTDASTFSTLPTNRTWRPLVSASLALDYRLAGGLKPLWFHITTFFWFLVQLALLYAMYASVLDAAAPWTANHYIALFTVAWYGLHPAIAETVNYIIQRGDLYSTLGVIAGLVMYIRLPRLQKFGFYLLPWRSESFPKRPRWFLAAFCWCTFSISKRTPTGGGWGRRSGARFRR